MKRLICAGLVLLLCVGAALAEGGMLSFTSADTEQKLTEMIPILDSLAVSLNVASDDAAFRVTYDPEDSQLIWNQLWRLSADWLSLGGEYQAIDGLKIPAAVMERCAQAAFGARRNPLPAIPGSTADGAVVYDPAADAYRVQVSGGDGHSFAIERYAPDGAALLVNCGLYDGQTNQRQGGMTARLEPAAEGAPYPYAVTDAHAEAENDFDGLWATVCDLRYALPEATATPLPTATAVPMTPTPTAAGYRTLSTGSRGEDVRALQERLNELGYSCGSADGVFGSGTRRAVCFFQEALGYSQTGEAGPELQRRLFSSGAPSYERYITLNRGSDGVRVEYLQDRLRELGYTGAPSDGSYGERLREAVTRFQREAGLKADGIAGPATLKALDRSGAPHCSHFIDLQKGDSGYRVREMQDRLRELGYYSHHPSGKYDGNTVEAVEAFKDAYDLHGNGRSASAETISLMFEDLDPIEDEDEDEDEKPITEEKDKGEKVIPDEDEDEEDDDDFVEEPDLDDDGDDEEEDDDDSFGEDDFSGDEDDEDEDEDSDSDWEIEEDEDGDF